MNSKKSTIAHLVAVCAAGLLHATPARAQIVAPREAAQIELGPLSLYPSVRLVDVGMDQNVYNDAVNPQDDFTFTLASRVLAVLRLGLNELMFSTGSDYVWFNEQASERSSNATYSARFNLTASRFKPYFGAERIRTRARPSVEIDARAQRVDRTLIAGTNFNLTERTWLAATAQYGDSTYQGGEEFRGVELALPLNRTSRTYSAGVVYAVTPLTTVSVKGNYTDETFPNSHLRDSKAYSITPVFEFAPEAAIRGTLSAGYELFMPEDPELANNKGLILEGALNWSIMGRTTFDLSVGRNVNYSYLDTEPIYLQTGARLLVTHRLVGPLSLQGSADRQHLSFRWRRGVSPTPGSEDREDTADVFGGGVIVNLGRGFAVMVGAEKARRHSVEDPRQNFDRTRLLSNVTIGQ
jgi:hypothetical protein